jgi:hypothetical protein
MYIPCKLSKLGWWLFYDPVLLQEEHDRDVPAERST